MAENNPQLGKDELRQMAKRLFDCMTEEAEVSFLQQKFKPTEKEHWADEYQDMIDRVDRSLEGNLFDSSETKEIMDRLLKAEGVVLDRDSHQYRQLAEVALKATIEALRMQQERLLGKFDPQPNSDVLPVTAAASTNKSANEANSILLRELIEKFFSENERSWKPKTKKKYRANLTVCAEIIGEDVQVSKIGKAEIREIKTLLASLPANWSKRYPEASMFEAAEIAGREGDDTLSPATANAYLTSLSSIFGWAVKQGYINSNPVSGMQFPDPVKGKDKRDSFSPVDLNKIFSAPIFTGMKSDHYWGIPGEMINRNHKYWIPLIALFAGMRLAEIINLNKDDFGFEDGFNWLIVRESKTDAGIRTVPIHPKLIEIGLLDYINSLQPEQPLFKDVSSGAYSKHFGRLLDSVCITDKKLVFHSFRHTFMDALRAAKVAEPIIKALVGHSDGSVTSQYGSGYPLEVLHGELKRVKYPSLTLPVSAYSNAQ